MEVQQQFISSYLYGAVCAKTGATFGLVLPHTNTRSMQLFLDELSKQVEDGYTGVDYNSTTQVAWLQSHGFTSVQSGAYWSSSTYAKGYGFCLVCQYDLRQY